VSAEIPQTTEAFLCEPAHRREEGRCPNEHTVEQGVAIRWWSLVGISVWEPVLKKVHERGVGGEAHLTDDRRA
jgi:hypothetical protein